MRKPIPPGCCELCGKLYDDHDGWNEASRGARVAAMPTNLTCPPHGPVKGGNMSVFP